MAVIGEGGVGLRIVVQVVDEAVKQLVGGVEIQLFGFSRVAFLKGRAQAAHLGRQAVFINAQLVDQPCSVGAGESAAGEPIEYFGKVLQAGLDRRRHMIRSIRA